MLPEQDPGEIVGMSGAPARNWLRTIGQGVFFAFDTGAAALDFLQSAGIYVPSSTFYYIRRQVLDVLDTSQNFNDLDRHSLIPMADHSTEHGLNLSAEFEYRLHEFGLDPETGLIKEQWITVASDRQLDKDTIESIARMYLGEGGESGNMVLEAFAEIESMRRA